MNNMNGFRVWDEKKKKMLTNTISDNLFLLDGCGNLYQKILYTKKIRVIPPLIAKERFVILLALGRYDISGRTIFEGDILRYETGSEFVVAFGTHPSFCHGDKMDTTNEGFCALLYEDGKAIANSFNAYPLSDLESLALVVGNMYEGYYQEDELYV